MAMSRNVSLTPAYTAGSVWCAVEPARKCQVALPSDRDNPAVSKTAPGTLVCGPSDVTRRRQVPAITPVRPFPTRQITHGDGILETEVERVPELRSMESTRAAFQGSFEAQVAASSGREICSSRGCRPILEEPLFSAALAELAVTEDSCIVHHGRSRGLDAALRIKPHILAAFASTAVILDKRSSAKMIFEAALQAAPRDPQLLSDFAVFICRTLGDLERADELYNAVSPQDSNMLASHAHFLWQCDQ